MYFIKWKMSSEFFNTGNKKIVKNKKLDVISFKFALFIIRLVKYKKPGRAFIP